MKHILKNCIDIAIHLAFDFTILKISDQYNSHRTKTALSSHPTTNLEIPVTEIENH